MDWSVTRISKEVGSHDRNLFAKRVDGVIQVWRRAERWESADIDEAGENSRPTQFILALTDNWQAYGRPVEWGIEPVMARVLEMDLHLKVSFLDEMRKQRERAQSAKEQTKRNEIRARAADMRKEFARATNDINTSNLEKIDNRRKYGNR